MVLGPKEWNNAWLTDGRPTPKTCQACGRNWTKEANVCGMCGVKLVENNLSLAKWRQHGRIYNKAIHTKS